MWLEGRESRLNVGWRLETRKGRSKEKGKEGRRQVDREWWRETKEEE